MRGDREVYLDNNATTRVLPLAAEASHGVMEELYGNPSSSHITGLRAKRILEESRTILSETLGASGGRIIFTSGATESIETAIFSRLCELKQSGHIKKSSEGGSAGPRLLLYGATEHKAVPEAMRHWSELLETGHEVVAVPVDEQGRLRLEFIEERLGQTDMLATMAVNNETGVIHDLQAVAQVLEPADGGVAWLVDCVQAVAKINLDLAALPIDYAAVSGHKLYAPKGVGALYVRDGVAMTPLLAGGGQEGGARGGTENLPGVAAFAAVLRELQRPGSRRFRNHQELVDQRDRLAASLRTALPGIVFNTPLEHAAPTTINFAVEGFTSKELTDLFDAAGVRVSSGSACGSQVRRSYVLDAMGLADWRSRGAIRMSIGPATTDDEIARACLLIEQAGNALGDTHPRAASVGVGRQQAVVDGLVQFKSGSDCSWVLSDAASQRCLIIDPFKALLDRIEGFVRGQGATVLAILDTHQHVDHESPRPELAERLQDLLEHAEQDVDILGWPNTVRDEVVLGDGSQAPCLRLSEDYVIAITPLPGHTVDAQAFLVGTNEAGRLAPEQVRFAFPGDTLLIGGVGRTDFHSSSDEQMLGSLRKLPRVLGDHTIVCPTHDYHSDFVTSLGAERQTNTFLSRVLDPVVDLPMDEYRRLKAELDTQITDETNSELVCGLITPASMRTSVRACSNALSPTDDMQRYLAEHPDAVVVDVRDASEFRFAQDWQAIGIDGPPRNVPLSRLADFLAEVSGSGRLDRERDYLFVCRSGNRSGKAAQVARRLGIENAHNIAGGIALRMPSAGGVAAELEYAI